jgi:hypothetical protein
MNEFAFGFQNNGSGGVTPTTPAYGSFYDTTTQSVTSGTATAMKLNVTDISQGISVTNNLSGDPTQITVHDDGVYNLQFSAQLNRTTGGASKQVDIWLAINGNPVSFSTTGVTMQANANKLVAAWNFFVTLSGNDFVEIIWTQDDAINILAEAATALYPETPSVIVTMNKIS